MTLARSAFALPLLVLLASTVSSTAQQNPPAAGRSSRIILDVIALDQLGHPVRGLQEGDFTVLDNGRQQKLVDFKAIDPTATPGALQAVIVVDMINTGFNEVAAEREQLGDYLNQDGGRLRYPTAIAAMTESGLKMMQGVTTDGHLLLQSFQKLNTDLRPIGRSGGVYGAGERLEWSLGQLSQIVAVEASRPGRKMVLVISPGWPMLAGASNMEDDKQLGWDFNAIVRITNGLRESHVTLYSLNPYLLGQTDPFAYESYLKGVKRVRDALYPCLALPVFAQHSGGLTLTQGRDVHGELNTAMRDAGPYYELTFEAQSPDKPDEYHQLQVKAARGDLSVRTSTSYYAEPVAVPAGKTIEPQPVR